MDDAAEYDESSAGMHVLGGLEAANSGAADFVVPLTVDGLIIVVSDATGQ